LIAASLVACSGGGSDRAATGGLAASASGSTGTPAATRSSATVTSPTSVLELDADAQRCVDAFVDFLVDIEGLVKRFDFEHASLFEYRDFSVAQAPAAQKLYASLKGRRCTGTGGVPSEDLLPYVRGSVERRAPGSVPYLELMLALSDLPVAGTCTKDMAALLRYVRAGGTVSDLTVPERFHAFSLAASVDFTCGLQGAGAFLNRDDVGRFLEIA
jgi:hypothetical protein